MKKRSVRKLSLSRETLTLLDASRLAGVAGAVTGGTCLASQAETHCTTQLLWQWVSACEASQVPNHPASERHHQIIAFEVVLVQKLDRVFEDPERLVTLTFRHQPFKHLEAFALQIPHNLTPVKLKNSVVGDDPDPVWFPRQ